jgi:hypothetical protein
MKALEILRINTVGHTQIYTQRQLNLCRMGESLLDKFSGSIENPPNSSRGILNFAPCSIHRKRDEARRSAIAPTKPIALGTSLSGDRNPRLNLLILRCCHAIASD